MRKFFVTAAIIFAAFGVLHSQTNYKEIRKLVEQKEYPQAAELIPEALTDGNNDAKHFLLYGDVYFELDKLDSALAMYEAADRADRNESRILRNIGKTLSAMGRHDEALEIIRKAIKKDGKDIKNYLQLGYSYLAADSLKEAQLYFTKVKKDDPKNADAYLALGDLYFAKKIYELAKSNYEEALGLNHELVDARANLATTYYWLGMRETQDKELANEYFKRSLKEWNTVTKQNPKNAKAFFQQGKILYFSKKYESAAQSFYEYFQMRPEGYLGAWYLSQSLYELGECDSAAPYLKIVSENIDSVSTKAKLYLAQCYFDTEYYEKAIQAYGELEKEMQLEAIDLERYGAAAFVAQDTALAVKKYEEAVNTAPAEKCGLAYKLAKILFYLQKDYEKTIDIGIKTLDNCEDDNSAEIAYYVGVSAFQLGRTDSAQTYLEMSVAVDSTFLRSHFYLGDVYAAKGMQDSSIAEFEYVVDEAKQDTAKFQWELANGYSKLAGLMLEKKNWGDLISISKDWTEIMPESNFAYLYLAIGYHSNQNVEAACRNYKKVISLDKDHQIAKIARDNLSKLQCP